MAASQMGPKTRKLISDGRRLVGVALILGVLLYIAGFATEVPAPGLFVGGLIVLFVSLFGLIRIVGGLGYSLPARIILTLFLLVPFWNLVTMLVMYLQATRVLGRSSGADA
jgi:hypothetical protein